MNKSNWHSGNYPNRHPCCYPSSYLNNNAARHEQQASQFVILMLTPKTLKAKYKVHKPAIEKRMSEFEEVGRLGEKRVFSELCFCILTPQSKAVAASKAIESLFMANDAKTGSTGYSGKMHGNTGITFAGLSEPQTAKIIKESRVRFHNTKAKNLHLARALFFGKDRKIKLLELVELAGKDEHAAREWIVKNIRGIGMKEAGHFLRNIGKNQELAILDRHIITNLHSLGAIKSKPKHLSKPKYLEIESQMRAFAKKTGIPMSHLDLLFWSEQTGFIFK